MPTSGTPRSLAALRWSPASTPSPPEYCGQRLGDAELGREVRHRPQRRALAGLEPAVAVEVALVLVAHLAEEAHEPRVVDEGVEPLAGDDAEQPHRVVHGRVPRVGVDPLEDVARLGVPRPPEVHGQLLQRRQLGGRDGRTVKLRRAFIPADPTQPAGWPSPASAPAQRAVHVRYRRRLSDEGGLAVAQQVRAVVAKAVQAAGVASRRSRCPTRGPARRSCRCRPAASATPTCTTAEGGINDEFPFLLGHEAAGVVEAVGPDVTDVAARRLRDPQLAGRVRRVPVVPPRAPAVLLQHPQRHAEDDPRRRAAVARRSASAPSPRRRSWPRASAPRCRPRRSRRWPACSAAA